MFVKQIWVYFIKQCYNNAANDSAKTPGTVAQGNTCRMVYFFEFLRINGATGICINVNEAPHNNNEISVKYFNLNAIETTMAMPNKGTHKFESKNNGINFLPGINLPSGKAKIKTPKNRNVINKAISSSE